MSIDATTASLPSGSYSSARNSARRAMFLSQDGVVLATTLVALADLGILEPSLKSRRSLAELCPNLTTPGFGALRVALHNLVAAGWLAVPATFDPVTTHVDWTEGGMIAMARRDRYLELGAFLSDFDGTTDDYWRRPWSPARARRFASLVASRVPGGELNGLLDAHLDGCLVVPAMLWLHETDRLGVEGAALSDDEPEPSIGRLFAALDWIDAPGGAWTEAGREAARFALNFGGVATYLPTLAKLPQLFRGELTISHDPGTEEFEWHVHRDLNVRISATAHHR
jgi:hypothetical protein